MSDLQWAFKLLDQFSSPAMAMANSVKQLANQLSLGETEVEKLARGTKNAGDALKKTSDKVQVLQSVIVGQKDASDALKETASAADKASNTMTSLTEHLSAAKAAFKTQQEAMDKSNKVMKDFVAQAGGAEKALQLLEAAPDVREKLGINPQTLASWKQLHNNMKLVVSAAEQAQQKHAEEFKALEKTIRAQRENAMFFNRKQSLDARWSLWTHKFRIMNRRTQGRTLEFNPYRSAVQWSGKLFGDKGASAMLTLGSAAAKADTALNKVGLSLGGVVKGGALAAGAAVAGLAVGVGVLVAKLGQLAVKGVVGFSKMAIGAGMARESALISFESMLKSKDAAQDVYDKAQKFAARTPFSTAEVVGSYQNLLAGGFKIDELEGMMTSISDMAAIKGRDQIGPLIEAFSKLRATGKLTMETMERFTTAGLGPKMVAEAAGVAIDQLSKLDGDAAEKAIRDAIEKAYGGAADKMAMSLPGLWSTLSSRANELFTAPFKKKSGGMTAFYDSIKKVLNWAQGAFSPDSPTGTRIVGFIDKIAGAFSKVFGDFNGNNATKVLDGILNLLERVVDFGTEALGGFIDGFKEGLGPAFDILGKSKEKSDGFKELAKVIGKVAYALGFFASISMTAYAAITRIYEFVTDNLVPAFHSVASAVSQAAAILYRFSPLNILLTVIPEAFQGAKSIGTNIVDGMIVGIEAGKSRLLAVVNRLTGGVLGAAQSGVDAHSPSRAMAKIGGYVSQGFALGIDADAPKAHASISELVAPPTPTFAKNTGKEAAQVMRIQPTSAGATTVTFGPITINGHGDAQSVKKGLLEALEQVGFELGTIGAT